MHQPDKEEEEWLELSTFSFSSSELHSENVAETSFGDIKRKKQGLKSQNHYSPNRGIFLSQNRSATPVPCSSTSNFRKERNNIDHTYFTPRTPEQQNIPILETNQSTKRDCNLLSISEETRWENMLGKIVRKLENLEVKIDCIVDNVCIDRNTQRRVRFEYQQISSVQKMKEFDEKLADMTYLYRTIDWLKTIITEQDIENRMHDALDILIDRDFFSTCTWSGKGKLEKKHAFGEFHNILKMFQLFAGNNFKIPTEEFVKKFIQKKLSHGTDRAKAQGIRKTSCHKRRIH